MRPATWPDNPAGKYAMVVDKLTRFYAFSGEDWFMEAGPDDVKLIDCS